MPRRADPPPEFFDHLERLARDANAELRALGAEPYAFACDFKPSMELDDGAWAEHGWWALVRVRFYGRDDAGGECVAKTVDPSQFRTIRKIQRVARPDPRPIRKVQK